MFAALPMAQLESRTFGGVALITDDVLFRATSVRLGFTERQGGASAGPYASLNLGAHVEDSLDDVLANRARLLAAVGAADAQLIVPKQVHGADLVCVDACEEDAIQQCRAEADAGADGVVVTCSDVAALLCFADCMPVVLVAPGGAFAVVHAGWRGVYGGIVPKALDALCHAAGVRACDCNVYIGPYIHVECFEVGADLAGKFGDAFGSDCVVDGRRVDLGAAMRTSLLQGDVNPNRIADAHMCTACVNDQFFSYRAQGGVCGRHGALAVRIPHGAFREADGGHAADSGWAGAYATANTC